MKLSKQAFPLAIAVITFGLFTLTLHSGGFTHADSGSNLVQNPASNRPKIALLDDSETHSLGAVRSIMDRRVVGDANSAHRNASHVATRKNPKQAAAALRKADSIITRPVGPADGCLAQMQRMLCPFFGNLPFVSDFAGQVAMLGNFNCPMAAREKSHI